MSSWRITENEQGVQFSLRVQPKSAKDELVGFQEDALKIKIAALPADGAANEACIKFIAKWLKVPRSSVEIKHGHSGRNKTIMVYGLDKESLLKAAEQI